MDPGHQNGSTTDRNQRAEFSPLNASVEFNDLVAMWLHTPGGLDISSVKRKLFEPPLPAFDTSEAARGFTSPLHHNNFIVKSFFEHAERSVSRPSSSGHYDMRSARVLEVHKGVRVVFLLRLYTKRKIGWLGFTSSIIWIFCYCEVVDEVAENTGALMPACFGVPRFLSGEQDNSGGGGERPDMWWQKMRMLENFERMERENMVKIVDHASQRRRESLQAYLTREYEALFEQWKTDQKRHEAFHNTL